MLRLAALLTTIVAILFLFACGGKNSPSQAVDVITQGSVQDTGAPLERDDTGKTLEEMIEQAEAYSPPEDVDAGVFDMLKEEFLRRLGENPERLAAGAPMSYSGRVTDLAYDPGSGMLTWTYVNLGDYNLSGDVSIADVAEIARYYLADATDGAGDDPYESWVDGSGDGEVNIADVAPLAQNYLNEVAEYVILTSETPEGEYTEIGRIDFSEAKTPSRIVSTPIVEAGLSNPARAWRTGQSALQFRDGDKTPSQTGVNFPKIFEVPLPEDALSYIAVQPVDSLGSPGQGSDPIDISPSEGPPLISSVSPLAGVTGNEVEFSAVVSGTQPFTYAWDFGGRDVPNTSTDANPMVTLGTEGIYSASLTVTNELGEDTFDFTLTVTESGSGGNWHIETVDSAGFVGEWTSIALDSSDNPHISYTDGTNTDLKYAYYK